jgi:hypothetical protein
VDTRFYDHILRIGLTGTVGLAIAKCRFRRYLLPLCKREGLRCAAIPLRRCRGHSAESGLR